MSKRFESLEFEKRKRIIDAACHEFAENGYEHASTNRIVKAAGIAKGTLFNYFESKQSLYHYLIHYAIDVFSEAFLNQIDLSETDLIERLTKLGLQKWKVFEEHQLLSNFFVTVGLNLEEADLPEPLLKKMNDMQRFFYKVLNENIDETKFRDDVDQQKMINLIRWSIEGYQNANKERFKGENLSEIDTEPLWKEYYEYVEILKICFYKEGEAES